MIYPNSMPENFPWGSKEDIYYERFKEELTDEFTVYYSVKFSMPDIPTREIDFLIVSKGGVLAIELKNSKWKLEGGEWFFLKNQQDWVLSKHRNYSSPLGQSETALGIFKTFLKNRNRFKLPANEKSFNYLVFFLKNSVKDFAKDIVRLPHILDANILKSKKLNSLILDFMEAQKLKSLDKSQLSTIKDLLANNFNFVQSFKSRIKKQRRELISLTKEQYDVLNELNDKGKILLHGIGGSGKTLIALEAATRANRDGIKTLFICHSSNLNSYLGECCQDFENVEVRRMADLCRKIILQYNPDFGKKKRKDVPVEEKITPEQFLKEILPNKTLEYIEEYAKDHKYQMLILDEGQDLLTENEMLIFDSLLEGGFDKSKWMICYDPRQALSGEIESGLSFLKFYKPIDKVLSHNIRTPEKTFELACKLGRKTGKGELSDVSSPGLIAYKNTDDGFNKLADTIDYIIKEFNTSPEDIIILSPTNKKNTEVIGSRIKITDDIKIKLVSEGKLEIGKVGFSEIRRFKGLELPYVILTGIDDFSDESFFNQMFVALTRATTMGFVLYPLKAKKGLEEALR